MVSGEPVTDRVDVLTMALQKQATVDDLAAFSYASQPYQSFYPSNSAMVIAAEEIVKKLK
ncbi:MAG TPA: hypothetical protein PKW24_02980 [Clostridiales bacterium]|nr:hypothetical protein [Clostridiales bacterium]